MLPAAWDRGLAVLEGCKAMTETIIMRGAYAITDPRRGASGVIPAGAVVIVDGIVRETGPFAAIAPKYPDIGVIGDGTQLLMPGLVDAHSHGRGLSPIQKGVRNDFLENALFDWAYMPILPPELTAAICALRHLRSGCTLLHHNGFDDDGVEGARRAHIAIRTYLSTGIRLAFSPGVRDESKLAMGGEEFIETLPPDLRVGARPFVFFDKEALADSYFRLFDELYDTYNNKDTRIIAGAVLGARCKRAVPAPCARQSGRARRCDDPYAPAAVAGAESVRASPARQADRVLAR
jgi:5-methylthioadenosine/S-adenosylhomocysteine deaminase